MSYFFILYGEAIYRLAAKRRYLAQSSYLFVINSNLQHIYTYEVNSMDVGVKGVLSPAIRVLLDRADIDESKLLEIRLRVNRPVILVYSYGENIIHTETNHDYIVNLEDIRATLDLISSYSLYSYEHELRQGFITIRGGHRVGVTGQVVMEGDRVKSVKHISFVNIRVSHEIKGCGLKILPYMIGNGRVLNTLIVSPPGCGKTTLLRDVIRLLSSGSNYLKGVNVGVCDERSELAACHMGIPQNDLGPRTDVMDACPKAEGMLMLLRSMNPRVIAVDEIGTREDVEAINYVINCGCSIIATIHGATIDDVRTRPVLRKLVEERVFERYIVLGNRGQVGCIENIFDERGNELYMPLLSVAN